MNAELKHHLGYEKHALEGRGSGNNRHGKSLKKVQGDFGAVEIEVRAEPRGFTKKTEAQAESAGSRLRQ
jgi:hypothetical protein